MNILLFSVALLQWLVLILDDSPAELSERDSEDLDISISSTNSSKAPEDKSALFDGTSNIITAESFDSSYQTRQTLTPPEQDALAPTMLNFEQFCDFIVQNEVGILSLRCSANIRIHCIEYSLSFN